ncbi:hypothetical protein [Empedobacter brevis]|uniref:hypothetical protein n=1 Tax=Empedobacter brevis TaxID=247 RepID=UPI0023F3DD0C|nr:hypothetical protein [Empedobacter brevis]
MTRIKLNRTIVFIIIFYTICIGFGVFAKYYFDDKGYSVFKDLLPFIFAIPAAYLVFCFQRRNEYLKALRTVYSLLVQVHSDFMEYTLQDKSDNETYKKIKANCRKAIEELRSVYENIDEAFGSYDGLYPFEPLKEIYCEDIETLHNGDFSFKTNENIRNDHYEKWKTIRINFIVELERTQSAFPVTKFKRRKQTFKQKIKNTKQKIRKQFFRAA